MARILIVDDDPHIRELVRHFLTRTGFQTVEAEDGVAALEALEGAPVDCVLLDLMMPKMDGWELCGILKQRFEVPVLMLTAKGQTAQKVKGLNAGADDYLVKPFDTEELLARVRALLRRYKIQESHKARIGSVSLDADSHEVIQGEERTVIPLKEFDLLFKLAGRPGTTFSRDQIIESVWGADFAGTERTVDVHVNRLRERFPEDQAGFRIVTVRGLGYRLEVLR